MAFLSAIATIAGTVLTAVGADQSAAAAKAEGIHRAQIAKKQGDDALAVGQRKMGEKTRQTQLLQSKILANAAASGGGADDPTVLEHMANTQELGTLDALTEFWQGDQLKRGYVDQANAAIFTGQAKASEARMKGYAGILSGVTSVADRFDSLNRRGALPGFG